jgi:hypothetical protein
MNDYDGDDDDDDGLKAETYECWKRFRHLLQRKSLSGKPTSPHMQQTVWRSTIICFKLEIAKTERM